MKKPKIKIILFLTILCVTAGFTLSACNVVNTYKVTFLSDGEVYATVEIKGGETIALPADPIKEGYTFDGWVYLNNPSINFDVSGKIIASIIVSAKWILDENGGTDLNGGVYAIYNVEKNSDGDEVTDAAVADTVNRLRGVLFNRGYTKATVVEQSSLGGTRQIRVEVPDVEDPQSLFDLLGRPALLEFKDPDNLETVYVTGQNVTEAYAGYSGTDPVVVLKFDADGTTAFRDATTAKVG
ncbi:MAG: InlB B-repeat-containing protein, partial [Clostridiales bacterium]|nr:InlB B-repeat-containing protein [Clostridiales bacterium]